MMLFGGQTCHRLRLQSWRGSLTRIATAPCTGLSGTAVASSDSESDRYWSAAAAEPLLAAYQRLLSQGSLQPDPSQASAVNVLQLLQDAVLQCEALAVGGRRETRAAKTGADPAESPAAAVHTTMTTTAATGRINAARMSVTRDATVSAARTVRGAYLWGPVGSGKTVLMDLFFRTTQRRLQRQRLAQLPAGCVPASSLERLGGGAGAGAGAGSDEGAAGTQELSPGAASAAANGAAAGAAAPVTSTAALEGKEGPGALPRPRSACRQHFHEFMQGIHGRLHALQQALPRVVARSRQGLLVYRYAEPEEDPLLTVAREWGSRTAVLCLDELHVTDVADAMILSRLFDSLLVDHSTAVVFTSNRPPGELYKGGLSRKYFEPFVRLVDDQMVVARVAADVDYRRTMAGAAPATRVVGAVGVVPGGASGAVAPAVPPPGLPLPLAVGSWFTGPGSLEQLRLAWSHQLAAGGGGSGGSSGEGVEMAAGPVEVPIAYGRKLKVPLACGDAAFLTFEQLCGASGLRAAVDDGGALGAPDFLALCRRFRELYVAGVPQLLPAQRDEARRLVTLLDVAYDNRCRLMVSAEVAPDALFSPLLAEARRQGVNPRLGLSRASAAAVAATASPTDLSARLSTSFAAAPTATPTEPAPSSSAGPADAIAAAAPGGFVPAASVTAALHMRLGPSMTHGSAATNAIHPSEFTGAAAAAAVTPPPSAVGDSSGWLGSPEPLRSAGAPPAQQPTTVQGLGPGPASRPGGAHGPGVTSAAKAQAQAEAQAVAQAQVVAQTRPITPVRPADLVVPRAVLAEEVLMYHRAASRLAEMCAVVAVADAVGAGGSRTGWL